MSFNEPDKYSDIAELIRREITNMVVPRKVTGSSKDIIKAIKEFYNAGYRLNDQELLSYYYNAGFTSMASYAKIYINKKKTSYTPDEMNYMLTELLYDMSKNNYFKEYKPGTNAKIKLTDLITSDLNKVLMNCEIKYEVNTDNNISLVTYGLHNLDNDELLGEYIIKSTGQKRFKKNDRWSYI